MEPQTLFSRLKFVENLESLCQVLSIFDAKRLERVCKGIERLADQLRSHNKKEAVKKRASDVAVSDLKKAFHKLKNDADEAVDENEVNGLVEKFNTTVGACYFVIHPVFRKYKLPESEADFQQLIYRLHLTFCTIFNFRLKDIDGFIRINNEQFEEMKQDHRFLENQLKDMKEKDGYGRLLTQFLVFCVVHGE